MQVAVWLGMALAVAGVLIFGALALLVRRRTRGDQVGKTPALLVGLALWAWGHAVGFVVGYAISETAVGGLVGLGVAAIAIAVLGPLLHIWTLKVQADRSPAPAWPHEDVQHSTPRTVVVEHRDSPPRRTVADRPASEATGMPTQQLEWPTNGLRGFIAGLFDLRLTSFPTRRFARIVYRVQVTYGITGYLLMVVVGFAHGPGPGLLALLFGAVVTIWHLTFARAAVQYHGMQMRAVQGDQRRS